LSEAGGPFPEEPDCIPGMEMYAVTKNNIVNEVGQTLLAADGILGLAPMGMYNPNSFIDKLVKAGVIDHRVFSFSLSKDRSGYPSMLTLGGYDISDYRPAPIEIEDEVDDQIDGP
jgi:hypothetical protein